MIRTLRRQLSDEAIALMDEQRANGVTPAPIHLMLVDESGPHERGRTACGGGLGEWVTGASEQVTCDACVEQVHG